MNILQNIVSKLPSLKPCEAVSLKDETVLITAGGFEDRALAAVDSIENIENSNVFVLEYKPNNKTNRLSEIIEILGRKGVRPENRRVIEFNRFNPEAFPKFLQAGLLNLNKKKIIIDVSAMSKLAQLLCLDVCWNLNLSTSVFYAEASEKGPSVKQFEKARRENNLQQPSIQVYTGIHGVVHVTALSSVAMQGQPSAAIVFMSFNELLTQALLDSVYPSRLFLINSRSVKWKWREEATAWIHEQLRSEWPSSDNPVNLDEGGKGGLPTRCVSTIAYKETVAILLDLYWNISADHRILLSPTGSKLQTLGCFFIKAMHPDIHIEYPTPDGFLNTYSHGTGDKWLVDFGPLKDLVKSLKSTEQNELNLKG